MLMVTSSQPKESLMDATITVTGNLGSEVDLRTGPNNEWAFAAFRLASTPRVDRKSVV